MPKRSNEFQEIVDIIQRLFAPQDAKVTTSAMIEVNPGEPKREVDVLVEWETDLYAVKIAVEARDHARAIDVNTVEQYMGKYNSIGGIVVNKVVIVAKAFTRTAVNRARQLGFDLHTLNSLEEFKMGRFYVPPEDKGGWWIAGEVGQQVKVSLNDKNNKRLADAYLNGTITSRVSKSRLGSPAAWARRILDNGLGEQAYKAYEEYAGEALHVIAELEFADHTIEVNSHPTIRLKHMFFDFGERVKLPDMQAKFLQLKTSPTKSKRIVYEKGRGKNAILSIVYEDTEKPSKIHLEGVPDTVTYRTIKLDD